MLQYTTLHYITIHYAIYTTPQLQLQLHYTNFTTLQLQLTTTTPPHYNYKYAYNYNYNCTTPHYIQQLWWGDHCNHCNPLQKTQLNTQLQPPFGPSVDSLCHPWFTTTNRSYRVTYSWNFRHRLVRYYWYQVILHIHAYSSICNPRVLKITSPSFCFASSFCSESAKTALSNGRDLSMQIRCHAVPWVPTAFCLTFLEPIRSIWIILNLMPKQFCSADHGNLKWAEL